MIYRYESYCNRELRLFTKVEKLSTTIGPAQKVSARSIFNFPFSTFMALSFPLSPSLSSYYPHVMESLSMVISCSLPLKTQKLPSSKPVVFLPKLKPTFIYNLKPSSSRYTHFPSEENVPLLYKSFTSNSPQNQSLLLQAFPFLQNFDPSFVITSLIATTTCALPCFASDSEQLVSSTEQVSDKINLEAILVSIDDFFNRNPFFVAGCTFIWLVVIPLTEGYFKKYKFISAIDAFRKLRDDPSAQLLDIRGEKTLKYMKSPNLKILNKSVFQVQFSEGDEDGFVMKVLENFKDAGNTLVCILDNFDGNSMKVAELLFKNGFKAAYAVKGGVRGKKGWMEIQETLLPPSVHIYPKKKVKTSQEEVKTSQEVGVNGGVCQRDEDKSKAAVAGSQGMNSKHKVTTATDSILHVKNGSRSSSPYPNYPDLKPPSSPTPSKP